MNNIRLNQVISTGDWIKIGVLLAIALIAWYYVFTLYSQPFDLPYEIQRQQLIQQHDAATNPPIGLPTK